MAPTRETSARPSRRNNGHPTLMPTPYTSGLDNGSFGDNPIIGSQHTTMPPTPIALQHAQQAQNALDEQLAPPRAEVLEPGISKWKGKADEKQRARTGAGIKKSQAKKATGTVSKLIKKASGERNKPSDKSLQKPFRFLDLPGEIRNLVYQHMKSPKQALLVHCPRMASLRPRTRLDRARPLVSDITGKEHDMALAKIDKSPRRSKSKSDNEVSLRQNNRPFFGLTQVCKQLRYEYRPIYLLRQEIGMDLNELVKYLHTYYHDASQRLNDLDAPGKREEELPFSANLTIAINQRPSSKERMGGGVEIWPLLDLWANSYKFEAGFGRYFGPNHYHPQHDGEAKDLYRLFGRRVFSDRSCGHMNIRWRNILRRRDLASVCIYRRPIDRIHRITVHDENGVASYKCVRRPTLPYIHIVFKRECSETWMTGFETDLSKAPRDWLRIHGFNRMEFFGIRVGLTPDVRRPLT